MKISLSLFAITGLLTAGHGHECKVPLEPYFVRSSTLKVSELLSVRGNPLDTILKGFDKMDTANCFGFRFFGMSGRVGKLIESEGFGMDRFSYRIGGDSAKIPLDQLIEVIEFRVDRKKYEKVMAKSEAKDNGAGAAPLILAMGVVMVYVLYLLADSNGGPFLAGGK